MWLMFVSTSISIWKDKAKGYGFYFRTEHPCTVFPFHTNTFFIHLPSKTILNEMYHIMNTYYHTQLPQTIYYNSNPNVWLLTEWNNIKYIYINISETQHSMTLYIQTYNGITHSKGYINMSSTALVKRYAHGLAICCILFWFINSYSNSSGFRAIIWLPKIALVPVK